jgi:hypothetical protein
MPDIKILLEICFVNHKYFNKNKNRHFMKINQNINRQ